jgi:transposase-like protein
MTSGLSVAQAARQVGVASVTVRSWVKNGTLRTVASAPLQVDAAQVAAIRAERLASFDAVADLQVTSALPVADASDAEAARLRRILRSVLASIEAYDRGIGEVRSSQRILLDALLDDMPDLRATHPARPTHLAAPGAW